MKSSVSPQVSVACLQAILFRVTAPRLRQRRFTPASAMSFLFILTSIFMSLPTSLPALPCPPLTLTHPVNDDRTSYTHTHTETQNPLGCLGRRREARRALRRLLIPLQPLSPLACRLRSSGLIAALVSSQLTISRLLFARRLLGDLAVLSCLV